MRRDLFGMPQRVLPCSRRERVRRCDTTLRGLGELGGVPQLPEWLRGSRRWRVLCINPKLPSLGCHLRRRLPANLRWKPGREHQWRLRRRHRTLYELTRRRGVPLVRKRVPSRHRQRQGVCRRTTALHGVSRIRGVPNLRPRPHFSHPCVCLAQVRACHSVLRRLRLRIGPLPRLHRRLRTCLWRRRLCATDRQLQRVRSVRRLLRMRIRVARSKSWQMSWRKTTLHRLNLRRSLRDLRSWLCCASGRVQPCRSVVQHLQQF